MKPERRRQRESGERSKALPRREVAEEREAHRSGVRDLEDIRATEDEEMGVRERPDPDELGGASEGSAGGMSRAIEGGRRVSAPDPGEDELSVAPEDLGRRFMEGATQDTHHEEEDDWDLYREETEQLEGEQNMQEMSPDVRGRDDHDDRLITHMPDTSDFEEKISRETRAMQAEQTKVRPKSRAMEAQHRESPTHLPTERAEKPNGEKPKKNGKPAARAKRRPKPSE